MKAQTPIDRALVKRTLAPVTGAWARQARRIDALSLRERAILFLSLVVVLAACFDSLLLSPLAQRNKQRSDLRSQQALELKQLRDQFIIASQNARSDNGPLQAQLDQAKVERTRLDEALRASGSDTDDEGLVVVLQRLLAQQPGLGLERLRILDDSAASQTAVGATAVVPAMTGVAWQGVELAVQGQFPEMHRYLQALERELPGLRWGDMRMTAGGPKEAPHLQVQLFLLRVQP